MEVDRMVIRIQQHLCPFDQIPVEMVSYILQYIYHAEDIVRIARVNKFFYHLTQSQELWRRCCFANYNSRLFRIERWNNDWRKCYIERVRKCAKRVNRILVQDSVNSGSFYTVDPDGSNKILVTKDSSRKIQYQQGTWSPLGDLIAVSKIDMEGSQKYSITTVRNDGEVFSVSPSPYPAFFIYWSPDDTRLMLLSNSQRFGFNIGLQYIDLLSSQPETVHLVDTGRPYFLSWCYEDGRRIVVHTEGSRLEVLRISDNPELFMSEKAFLKIDIDGAKTSAQFTAPFWNSGNEVVYATTARKRANTETELPNNKEAYIVCGELEDNVVTLEELSKMSTSQLFATCQELQLNPQSDDRTYLLSILSEYFNSHIRVKEEIIMTVDNDYFSFVVSKDGNMIAIVSNEQLFVVNKTHYRQLKGQYVPVKVTEQAFAYFWSPNSRYLLFLTLPPGQTQINENRELCWSIHDTLSGETYPLHCFRVSRELVNNYLPFFCQYAQSLSFFSPDSQYFVYCDDTYQQVYVSSVSKGSKPVKIGTGVMATWSPC